MTWIDISLEKIYKWPGHIWKDAQHHYSSAKYKSKSQWNITLHPLEWLELKSQIITIVSGDVEKSKPLHIIGRNVKLCNHCQKYL